MLGPMASFGPPSFQVPKVAKLRKFQLVLSLLSISIWQSNTSKLKETNIDLRIQWNCMKFFDSYLLVEFKKKAFPKIDKFRQFIVLKWPWLKYTTDLHIKEHVTNTMRSTLLENEGRCVSSKQSRCLSFDMCWCRGCVSFIKKQQKQLGSFLAAVNYTVLLPFS